MARTLRLSPETVEGALKALVDADLIAATERVVQVLPVPDGGTDRPAGPAKRMNPPKTTSPALQPHRDVSEDEIRAHESQARALIARFHGKREPSAGVVRALAQSLALKGIDRERR
jgi:hypothetical protein